MIARIVLVRTRACAAQQSHTRLLEGKFKSVQNVRLAVTAVQILDCGKRRGSLRRPLQLGLRMPM